MEDNNLANLRFIEIILGDKAPEVLLESRNIVKKIPQWPIIYLDEDKKIKDKDPAPWRIEEKVKELCFNGIKEKFPDLRNDIINYISDCILGLENKLFY